MGERAPEPEKDHPGVIAPPPLIFAGVLAAALGIDLAVDGPSFGLPDPLRDGGAVLLFVIGLLLPMSAIFGFRAARTDPRPSKASTALVTTGIYRYTRNPMYLGMVLVYAGFSLLADSVIALAFLVPLLPIITYGVIKREELYLEVKFGDPYRRYREQVRRWL